MKKIAFIVSTLNTGGAQRAVSNIIINLPKEYQVDLILNSSENIVYPYHGKIINLDIAGDSQRSTVFYQLKCFIKRMSVISKLKKKEQYDTVISFMDSANIVNILTGNKYSKTVISVRIKLSEIKDVKYKYLISPLVKLIYNKADKIVALSEGVKADLITNYFIKKNKIQTIYNGYDIAEIRKKALEDSSENELEWFNADKIIVTMGRLENQKAHWHLVRVFAKVVEKYPNSKLIILGTGSEESYLRKLIQALGIQNNVVLAGFCNNPFRVIRRCDLFVFPSLYEGFGNALAEALACGIPCIATDYKSGAREILSEVYEDVELKSIDYAKYGVLVPVPSGVKYGAEDKLEMAERLMFEAILELLQNQKLYSYYKNITEECINRFSIKACIKKWIEIF